MLSDACSNFISEAEAAAALPAHRGGYRRAALVNDLAVGCARYMRAPSNDDGIDELFEAAGRLSSSPFIVADDPRFVALCKLAEGLCEPDASGDASSADTSADTNHEPTT
jgi:hypothetical protein